jgi:hypothetical protein
LAQRRFLDLPLQVSSNSQLATFLVEPSLGSFLGKKDHRRGGSMKIHNHICLLLAIGVVLVAFASNAIGRDGDPDARGRINYVKNGTFEIIVEGETSGGPLWLGCTLFPGTDREQDLEAKQSNNKFLFWCSGDFKKKFDLPSIGSRLYEIATKGSSGLDVPYVVALWRWKVDRSECKNGPNGGPCEWCRKNGYHLEDRVDIGRGTWSFEEKSTDRNDLRRNQRDAERTEEESKPFSERLGVDVVAASDGQFHGVRVVRVHSNSKAAQAGIEKGDLIYELVPVDRDGNPRKSLSEPSVREFDNFSLPLGYGYSVKINYLASRLSQYGKWRTLKHATTIRY